MSEHEHWEPRPVEKAPRERLTGVGYTGSVWLPSWRSLLRPLARFRKVTPAAEHEAEVERLRAEIKRLRRERGDRLDGT